MGEQLNGPRFHDPDIRELTAEVDGLRELTMAKLEALRDLLDERDRMYAGRDEAGKTAVDAALVAVKEQTKNSFDASEKAIKKAEEAQTAYNVAHNATMPRLEMESRIHALEAKIVDVHDAIESQLEAAQSVAENRALRIESVIDTIKSGITPGLGPRVSVLEIAKSNLDGRFWALAAIVVIVTLVLQALPFLIRHTP
jgi:hypothetical protein